MFKQLRGRIRDWWKPAPDPDHQPIQFKPKAHPSEQLRRSEAIEFPKITNRARWVSYGFNRKERRGRARQIRRNGKFHPKGADPIAFSVQLGIEKLMLKANPKNFPVRVARERLEVRRNTVIRKQVVTVWPTNNPFYGVEI